MKVRDFQPRPRSILTIFILTLTKLPNNQWDFPGPLAPWKRFLICRRQTKNDITWYRIYIPNITKTVCKIKRSSTMFEIVKATPVKGIFVFRFFNCPVTVLYNSVLYIVTYMEHHSCLLWSRYLAFINLL